MSFTFCVGGEHRDARLDRPGWSKAGFFDKFSLWSQVEVVAAPGNTGVLSSQLMEPIRVMATLKPVKVWQPSDALNTYVVDFGQNMAGWVRIKVQGARGRSVHIRYAEILEQPSPSSGGIFESFPYFDNLRGAAATDVYVFKGDDPNVYLRQLSFFLFTISYDDPNINRVNGMNQSLQFMVSAMYWYKMLLRHQLIPFKLLLFIQLLHPHHHLLLITH
jgi:hypothetical protein